MNVPKTPDHKLIGAVRALANDALTADAVDLNVLPAVLHEAADRLAELFKLQEQLNQAQKTCEAIRAYRECKATPSANPDKIAKLREAKNQAYFKWLEMEVNPYGQ